MLDDSNTTVEVSFFVDDVEYKKLTIDKDSAIELPDAPTKEGYIFDGWYVDKGEWTQLLKADTKVEKSLSVYAKWTEPHTHNFGAWEQTTAPSCTVDGEQKRTCSCGETETQTVSATGHSYGAYVSDGNATCTADGTKTATCSVCHNTDTIADSASALGHSGGTATCTAKAVCAVCHEEYGEALGHTFDGKICTVCGYAIPSEGLGFTLNDGGESYTLTSRGTCADVDIVIPPTYNDKSVIRINKSAFYVIYLPDSVTRPDSLLGGSDVNSIHIPSSVS